MINSKATKAVILEAYKKADFELTETKTQLRIALIWAIVSTAGFLVF